MSVQAEPDFAELYNSELPDHPYPGLRPFREDEWAIFFGRESIIDEVTGILVSNQFVSVHGDSGSGKSSLVRAGVLPRLVQDLGRAGAAWRTATMEPGNAPMRNLAKALAELGKDQDAEESDTRIRRILNQGRDAGPALVEELRRDDLDHLCILVDQFEEIFSVARRHGRSEAELFIEVLTGIQQQKPDGLHVILTMRSEYLGACARFQGLAEAINDSQYLLPPMNRPSLIRAIREPAQLYGGTVKLELAERLIADAGESQDQLPLIQHGLMVMQRRKMAQQSGQTGTIGEPHWTLSLDDYRNTNGVVNLLSDHADQILREIESNHPTGGQIIETVFRALTDIDADGHAIRRRQTVQQLSEIAGIDPRSLADILGPLRRDGVSFLRPYGEEPLNPSDEINISHEALIRCWSRIADPASGWLQEEFRDGLIWKSLLVAADGFKADRSAVLSGAVTGERERWLERHNATWSERYGGRFDDVQALMQASAREIRRQKILYGLLTLFVVGVIALGAYLLTSIAENEKLQVALGEAETQRLKAQDAQKRATLERQRAEDALIAAQANLDRYLQAERENNKLRSQLLAQKSAEATGNGDAGTGLATALEVLKDSTELPYVPEAERSAYSALANLRERRVLRGHDGDVVSASYSPDSSKIVTAGEDDTVRIWNTNGGGAPRVLRGHDDDVYSASYSPDGTRIVSASTDGTIRIWQTDGRGDPLILRGHEAAVHSATFNPDGTRIVSASRDQTVRVWNAGTANELMVLKGHEDWVFSAAFSPDGSLIATAGGDGTVRIWSADSGSEMQILNGHKGPVYSAVFDPSGTRIVSAGTDATVRIWDLDGKGEPLVLNGHEDDVKSAVFTPDGDRIVSASNDGTIRVWAVDGSTEPLVLRGHDGWVGRTAISPDGNQLVSPGQDSTVRIWALEPALSGESAGPMRVTSRSVVDSTKQGRREVDKSSLSMEAQRSTIAISPSGDRIVRKTGSGLLGDWYPNESQELVADRELAEDYPYVLFAGFAGERPVSIVLPGNALLPFEFLIGIRYFPASQLTLGSPDTAAFAPSKSRVALYFARTSHLDLYEIGQAPKLVARVQIRNDESTGASQAGPGALYLMAFEPNGDSVVGVSESGDRLFRFDLQSINVLPKPAGERPYFLDVHPEDVRTSPTLFEVLAVNAHDNKVSVVAVPATRSLDNLVVGDLLTDEEFTTIRPGPNERRPLAAALSADSRRVALVTEQGINIYSREREGVIGRFAIPGRPATAASFSDNGTALVATSTDGTIGYWQIFPTTDDLTAFAERAAPRRLTKKQLDGYLETPKSSN